MAIGTKLGPDGRPIEDFWGGGGLGGALAQLPGTPGTPGGGAPPDLTGTPPSTAPPGYGAGYTEPDDPYRINEGPGYSGWGSGGSTTPAQSGRNTGETGGSRTGGTPPLSGGTPVANPGLPPPNAPAGVQSPGADWWGGVNPYAQNVTASMNNQPVSFASPGNPNTNYLTPEAANKMGQFLGANVVEQNLNNMASPGSGAPSAPMYGLDFGQGDVLDPGMGAFQLARGDRPEDVAARYKAGLNPPPLSTHPPPSNRSEQSMLWNTASPVSTYDPQKSNAQQAALIQWLKGQVGQG